jgi:hypothetical protein
MIDYIAYLEVQRKMRDQFTFRDGAIAGDTPTEPAGARPNSSHVQWRHGLAEALRAAASRLDPVPA